MSAPREVPVETYGLENDLGPVMEVQAARNGGVRIAMEVGWWGIIVTLDPNEVQRLRDQLDGILAR